MEDLTQYPYGRLPCGLHFMEELTRYSGDDIDWKIPTKFVIPDRMKRSKPRAYTPQSGLCLGLNWRMLKETEESRTMTQLKAKWAVAYLRLRRRQFLRSRDGPLAGPAITSKTRLASGASSIEAEWEDFVDSLEIQFPGELACYELGFHYDPVLHASQLKSVLATDALFVVLFLLLEAGELSDEDDFTALAADPQFKFRVHTFWNDMFLLENQIPWRVLRAVLADFCTFGSDDVWKKALHAALKAMFKKLFRLSDNAFFHLSNKQKLTFVDHLEVSFNNLDSRPRHLLDYLLAFICFEPTDWAKTWELIPAAEGEGQRYTKIKPPNRTFQIPPGYQVEGLGKDSSRERVIELFLAPTVQNAQVETARILEELDKRLKMSSPASSVGAQGEQEKSPLLQKHVPGVQEGQGVSTEGGPGNRLEGGGLPVRQKKQPRLLHKDLLLDPLDPRYELFRFLPARVTLLVLTLLMNVLIAVTWILIILRNAFTWIVYRCLVLPIGSFASGLCSYSPETSERVGRRLDLIECVIPFDFIRESAAGGRRRWRIVPFDFEETATTHDDDGVWYLDVLGVATMEWLETFVVFLSVAIFTKEVLINALRKEKEHEDGESREKRCALILAYFEERAAVMRRLYQELHPSHPVHALLKLLFPDDYWNRLSETKDWAAMVQVLLEAVAARPPVDPTFAKAITRALPNAFNKLRTENGWPVVFLIPDDLSGSSVGQDKLHVDSANTLAAAGIQLGMCNNLHQVDIEPASRLWFSPRACLRLPQLRMHEGTESLIRNLATWELIKSDGKEMPLASYIKLMDNLIDTEEDVVLMKEAKVIDHHLASDKAVADLWNELFEGLRFLPSDRWARVLSKVNQERNRYWGKMLAELLHTYFSSPWAFIALVAAILLLLLTIA